MVAPVREEKAPNSTGNIIAALISLQNSPGWAIIKKILDDNISYLEKSILDKIDPIAKCSLSDEDVELLRLKRNLNIDLRDTPKNFLEAINRNSELPQNYDPYYKTNDEILKAKKKEIADDNGK